MLLSRFFGRRDIRSIRRPQPRRRPLIEALEGRQLLSTYTVRFFEDVADDGQGLEGRQLLPSFTVTKVTDGGPSSLRPAIVGNHIGTNAVQGNQVGKWFYGTAILAPHIGTNVVQGNHIRTNADLPNGGDPKKV